MKRTIIYHIFNKGKDNEWREPYYVTKGEAEILIRKWPQYYTLGEER